MIKFYLILFSLLSVNLFGCIGSNSHTSYKDEFHQVDSVRGLVVSNYFITGIGNKRYRIYLSNGDSITTGYGYKVGDTIIYRYYYKDTK
jgi:hypothetical protein